MKPSSAVQLPSEETRDLALREVEDALYERNLAVLHDVMAASEIDPSAEEPPEHWVVEYGPQEAARRFRMARAGWMSTKDAPVVITVAKSVVGSILKARAAERGGTRVLNAVFVQMVPPDAPQYDYGEPIEVEDRDE